MGQRGGRGRRGEEEETEERKGAQTVTAQEMTNIACAKLSLMAAHSTEKLDWKMKNGHLKQISFSEDVKKLSFSSESFAQPR